MSSTAESPDGGMALQSHYSLRWSNHQTHILQAFEALLHAEMLVDVTLVCSESSLRAHKVVLSACSPFFERIFAEHPCKHPVIVLKDFTGREVAALIDFMYRGEVRVGRDELPGLIRAAESLQVKGFASSEPRPIASSPIDDIPIETPTDLLLDDRLTPDNTLDNLNTTNNENDSLDEDMNDDTTNIPSIPIGLSIAESSRNFHQLMRDNTNRLLPPMSHLNFSLRELRESSCSSPLIPRRKQARPRRRSGDDNNPPKKIRRCNSSELIPEDLSRPHPPPSLSPPTGLNLISSNNNNNQQISGNSNVGGSGSGSSGTTPLLNFNQHLQSALISHQHQSQQQQQPLPPHLPTQLPPINHNQNCDDIAENLSMKRSSYSPVLPNDQVIKTESEAASSPRGSPLTGTSLHQDGSLQDLSTVSLPAMSALSLTPPHHHSEYLTSLGQLAAHWLPNHQPNQLHNPSLHPREGSPQSHSRLHPFQQESGLTSRKSVAVFPLDAISPLGHAGNFFPHAAAALERGSLLADLHDSFKPEALHGLFGSGNLIPHPTKKSKKNRGDSERRWADHNRIPIGRPKGQHSAPRGGPPRSWTNAELTEALQHVWNKKMTTSQASRTFGIPYNSLLMYVRGKYGKSLKLEQLRRDCIGTTGNEVMNSLNNNIKSIQQPSQLSHPLAGLAPHPDDNTFVHHSMLGGNLPQGFFPDFSAAFPVPVSMVHLLPPSEQKAIEPPPPPPPTSMSNSNIITDRVGVSNNLINTTSINDLTTTPLSRSPSPTSNNNNNSNNYNEHHQSIPQPPQSAPVLLQQNGSE